MVSPVRRYLDELRDPARPIVVSRLVTLSNLDAEELSQFQAAWPQMAVGRRRRILRELVGLAEDNVELNFDAVFLAALGDVDPDVRCTAIRGLWEYEGRDLIRRLAALLREDPQASVRAEAALAMARFVLRAEFDELPASDAERVESALRAAIADDGEAVEVRARAVEAIGARSLAWAQSIIEQAYGSPERRLRVSAVHAMGRSCDPAWLPVLFRELTSDDAEMRYEAAGACGSIGDERGVPHLVPLIADRDGQVQAAAIGALGEIGGPDAKRVLQQATRHSRLQVREAALAALAEAEFNENPLGFGGSI